MCKFFKSYEESLHLGACKPVKYVRNYVVFWKNLHSWQNFYMTAGHDGRDIFQVWCCCLVEILKLTLGRYSEDEIWSRFLFELVRWPKQVTFASWTQPSHLLCLWQCLFIVFLFFAFIFLKLSACQNPHLIPFFSIFYFFVCFLSFLFTSFLVFIFLKFSVWENSHEIPRIFKMKETQTSLSQRQSMVKMW